MQKEGYDIAVNYRTENEDLVNTKSEIEKLNVQCFAVQGDVSDFEDTEKMVKRNNRKIWTNRCISK